MVLCDDNAEVIDMKPWATSLTFSYTGDVFLTGHGKRFEWIIMKQWDVGLYVPLSVRQ